MVNTCGFAPARRNDAHCRHMTTAISVRLAPDFDATDPIGLELARCWLEVSNAGGAVGFPFIPVSEPEVAAATERLASDVAAGSAVLLIAESAHEIVGWVCLRLNTSKVARHWATVERLQRRPDRPGAGIGSMLMRAATDHAKSRGLEHLRLVLRGGMQLEDFYQRLGWTEIGRHPGALRLATGDDRDEVSMMLDLAQP